MSVTYDFAPWGKKAMGEKTGQSEQFKIHSPIATPGYCDLLTLRPEGRLRGASSKARGAELRRGLPTWNRVPLDHKLPLLEGPRGPFIFSRAKLGEKLWRSSPTSDFQLDAPQTRFDYEPAHDRHLRSWLRRPANQAGLRDQGLVAPGMRVACSLQQYNQYRQFLYNLHRDRLRAEAEWKENKAIENLLLKKAQENVEKDAAKQSKYEDTKTRRMSNLKRVEIKEMEKLEKCRKRLQRVIDLAASEEERKEADRARRKERMEAFDRKIESRILNANRIERKNKIKAMKAWHKMDVEKKRQFENRKRQRELENKQKAEARWNKKVEEQKKQIEKEKLLYAQRNNTKEFFVQQYMRAMKKEWSRMEDELNKRKYHGALFKVNVDKRKKSIKQIIRSVSEAYSTKKSLGFLSQDEEAIATLMDHIRDILKEIRYDLEPYIVIAHAKERLERQENVPLPVSAAIKYMMEQTIVEYTANQLSSTVSTIAKKVLTAIDDLKGRTPTVGDRSLSMRGSCISGVPYKMSHRELNIRLIKLRTTLQSGQVVLRVIHSVKSLSSGEKTIRISMIEEIPVYKESDELIVGVNNLRSTRDRRPTPMPSIETLTTVLFNDSDREEFEEDDLGEFTFIEQKKLNMTINDISNKIYRMIPSRVRSVVESRSYDRISTYGGSENDYYLPDDKPVAKLCFMILFDEFIRDHDLNRVVDRIILGFMQDIDLTPSFLRLKIRQKMDAIK